MSGTNTDSQSSGGNEFTIVAPRSGGDIRGMRLTGDRPQSKTEGPDTQRQKSVRRFRTQSYSTGINPLIAAASPLLEAAGEIKRTNKSPTQGFSELNDELQAYLNDFPARAVSLGVESSSLKEASYVLCTLVDEAVLQTDDGRKSNWSRTSLLHAHHQETSGGEKFFDILQQMSCNPHKHVNMLELMYVCLAFGFKGKYGLDEGGGAALQEHRNDLYRAIRLVRGDPPRELSPHWRGLTVEPQKEIRIVPWWHVLLFTLAALAIMYTGFAWVLSVQREEVLDLYRQLDPEMISTPSYGRDPR